MNRRTGIGAYIAPILVTVFVVVAGLTGCSSAGSSAGTAGPVKTPQIGQAVVVTRGPHAIKTVFIIMMENHNWSDIAGNTGEAPYINRALLPRASYATQYYNPPGNHPSLPNYLWLEAGQCYSYCGTDADPSLTGIHGAHLTTLLSRAGISWKAYEESVVDGACPMAGSSLYGPRHDPFVYFSDVTRSRSFCAAHVRSFSDLSGDLTHNRVARYNFITPNICDDMHSPCAPTNDEIRQGDAWLSRHVPAILRSRAYTRGGALFITWDEAASGDGPIGMIVLSPDAKGHGYHNAIRYTHSSTLRTIEEIFGVRPMLGHAQRSNDLRGLFRVFP